ncbi:hypothetical protein B0A48_06912 [Cryoendolithus antarcticus]|uniref:Uncharacterized protein n=1 Tax=Cryoendolithus antarcticus TaxID=1507870 RepID=A0A1V8TA55_9PEZI|nr:hypothetical protein B0A48_06912 [Cryoendolithus antarcticus]
MASRILRPSLVLRPTPLSLSTASARTFRTTSQLRAEIVPPPVRKPVGAFRGTIFGFLLGTTLAGTGLYYYVVDEYKVSNELLTEDVYALQGAVQRLEGYVRGLEEDLKTRK